MVSRRPRAQPGASTLPAAPDGAPPMPTPAHSPVLVEACVTSVDEAVAAVAAGAGRLELCRDLDLGGLTPGLDLVAAVKAAVAIPVFCMARPRAGGFVLAADEVDATLHDVGELAAAGADGVVVGFLRPDGTPDTEATARAVAAAGGLPVTFHKAFDQVPDPLTALEGLAEAGVARVLTAGGPGAARENADVLAGLVAKAADSRLLGRGVGILVGGGVRADHVRHLVAHTGAREVHARASAVPGVCRALRGQ